MNEKRTFFSRRKLLAAAGLSAAAWAPIDPLAAVLGADGTAAGAPVAGALHAPPQVNAPPAQIMGAPADAKVFRLEFASGDWAMAGLYEFVKQRKLSAGYLSAVGSFSRADIGSLDPRTNQIRHNPVNEQAEVAAFGGNLWQRDGKPFIHVHVVLALLDGTTRGGHLFEGQIHPLLQVVFAGWE
jgi:hypothetical protein